MCRIALNKILAAFESIPSNPIVKLVLLTYSEYNHNYRITFKSVKTLKRDTRYIVYPSDNHYNCANNCVSVFDRVLKFYTNIIINDYRFARLINITISQQIVCKSIAATAGYLSKQIFPIIYSSKQDTRWKS